MKQPDPYERYYVALKQIKSNAISNLLHLPFFAL